MNIQTLYDEVETTRLAWMELYGSLTAGKYDLQRSLVVLDAESIALFNERVNFIVESLFAMRPKSATGIEAIVVGSRLGDLISQLRGLSQHTLQISQQLQSNWREGATIREGNDQFFLQLYEAESNYANLDMAANVAQAHTAAKYLVGLLGSMLPICKAEGVGDLLARSKALATATREAEALRKQAQQSAKAADASAATAAQHQAAAAEAVAQSQTIVAGLRELQQRANTDSSSVSTLVEQIKTIGTNADKLEALIGSYQSKFEAFQKDIDERNAAFAKFQDDALRADTANEARETEIDRLAKQADSMISGATTAGLGKSLEDTRLRYEDRMNSARRGFQWSVVFLIVSALPLAAHLLPGLLGDWFPKVSEAAHASWYGVLGKILLMVPATWLTGFYTKTYADFFHLEREYAHKVALAGAVDGFKRQAPQYQEEITAEVFLEIRNNPAKGQSSEPAAHPLYDVLAKAVSKVAERKKDGESK